MNRRIVPFIVDDHIIKAYWLGKWRTLRYYGGNKDIPSKKIQQEVIETFRMNAGVVLQNAEIVPDWQVNWRLSPVPSVMEHSYE